MENRCPGYYFQRNTIQYFYFAHFEYTGTIKELLYFLDFCSCLYDLFQHSVKGNLEAEDVAALIGRLVSNQVIYCIHHLYFCYEKTINGQALGLHSILWDFIPNLCCMDTLCFMIDRDTTMKNLHLFVYRIS